MIHTAIKDSSNGNTIAVCPDGEIGVIIHAHPPKIENQYEFPYSQFMTLTGDSGGNRDMRVDGSVTPVEFFVGAVPGFDLFIHNVSFQISDNGARLDRFGALPALTNGVKLVYTGQNEDQFVLNEGYKTNLEVFRDASGGKDFGSGTDAWRADISGGGTDTYFPEINFEDRFNLYYGLRIEHNSQDRLSIIIQDDLTGGLDIFDVRISGKMYKVL